MLLSDSISLWWSNLCFINKYQAACDLSVMYLFWGVKTKLVNRRADLFLTVQSKIQLKFPNLRFPKNHQHNLWNAKQFELSEYFMKHETLRIIETRNDSRLLIAFLIKSLRKVFMLIGIWLSDRFWCAFHIRRARSKWLPLPNCWARRNCSI